MKVPSSLLPQQPASPPDRPARSPRRLSLRLLRYAVFFVLLLVSLAASATVYCHWAGGRELASHRAFFFAHRDRFTAVAAQWTYEHPADAAFRRDTGLSWQKGAARNSDDNRRTRGAFDELHLRGLVGQGNDPAIVIALPDGNQFARDAFLYVPQGRLWTVAELALPDTIEADPLGENWFLLTPRLLRPRR